MWGNEVEKPKRKQKRAENDRLWRIRVGIGAAFLVLLIAASLIIWLTPVDPLLRSGAEAVTVNFSNIEPVYTQRTYSGEVTLIVSGTGQAGGTDWSDAFYLYQKADGSLYNPPMLQHFDLEIDGRRAIETLRLLESPPAYTPEHIYQVAYNVGTEARRIAFRISDEVVGDNTGTFRIEIIVGLR